MVCHRGGVKRVIRTPGEGALQVLGTAHVCIYVMAFRTERSDSAVFHRVVVIQYLIRPTM